MDNILITWTFMVVVGFSIDVFVYVLLRSEWKRSGVMLTDKLWNQARNKLGQIARTGGQRLLFARPQPAPASALPEPLPSPLPSQVPLEVIVASVETIGGLRRVEFSLEMQMNTTMEVRIGATSEAGVKVEKREL